MQQYGVYPFGGFEAQVLSGAESQNARMHYSDAAESPITTSESASTNSSDPKPSLHFSN